MSTQEEKKRLELLHRTLDILILHTLIFGPSTGRASRAPSNKQPTTSAWEHGAWRSPDGFPRNGGISSNNRKARFYSLTAAGRKQLLKETTKWKWLMAAIGRILGSEAMGS